MKTRNIFLLGCGALPALAFAACLAVGLHARKEKELAELDETR